MSRDHLVVEVRPAFRPSRWAWHLVDSRDRRELETEFEYESASQARRAGLRRLDEVVAADMTAGDDRTSTARWRIVAGIRTSGARAA